MTTLASDLLEPLDAGDTAAARARLATALAAAGMAPDRLAALGGLGRWNADRDGGGLPPAVADALADAVRRTAADPATSALLALCLRAECEAAWEVSWDHEPVRAVIDTALAARPPGGGTADAEWALLALVGSEMLVETAASSGSLPALERQASATTAAAEQIAGLVAGRADDPFAAHTAEVAEGEAVYYRAVAGAARAVTGHLAGAGGGLGPAIAALAAAEDRCADDDAGRSELRAHRGALAALRASADRPVLRIESGSVVYLYPFGLRGVTPGAALRALRETGSRWTLAGLPVTALEQELPLNDVWRGNDPLDREYAGAVLTLPDVLVPAADGGEPHRLQVEVRLTGLGNHCVRLVTGLSGASPHTLYAAQALAAPEAGDLRELGTPVRPADGPPVPGWGRLSDLAAAICGDLCGQFAEHASLTDVQVSTRSGTYHVLTRIERAVAREPDGTTRPVEDPAALPELVGGALLGHPVRHGVSAIAEWAGYRADGATLIDSPGTSGLVLRTANTTAIACPAEPSYMVDAVQEAAEFVATLDGLFAGWQVELADHYYRINQEMERLQEEIDRPSADGGWDPSELDATQRALEAAQHEMQLFVMGSRLRLMFITAPSLVTSPVMRTTLDRLLAAAGFERARADFVGTIEDVVGDRAWSLIESSVRRRQELVEERRRAQAAAEESRGRRRMDILLAAVAAVGISGIFSILQAGYAVTGWRSAVLAGSALLAAAAIGAITHRLTGSPRTPVPEVTDDRPGRDRRR
ncbi:hypothetical protein [Blastococcus xanthinilyticus]|uniref:Uncharacterized protein n=1 Tax=Blastococcus xanthinilyticus TaxID=1564164 RepID=A0A5S5D087_9ACTN|nr:hypothetical protein [Blastococcus xanthinilyticus]TYP88019.1 hypothetical protein BD833_105195 [Blastococcus xanthinilyticus]